MPAIVLSHSIASSAAVGCAQDTFFAIRVADTLRGPSARRSCANNARSWAYVCSAEQCVTLARLRHHLGVAGRERRRRHRPRTQPATFSDSSCPMEAARPNAHSMNVNAPGVGVALAVEQRLVRNDESLGRAYGERRAVPREHARRQGIIEISRGSVRRASL
jgi:hypothetical protein